MNYYIDGVKVTAEQAAEQEKRNHELIDGDIPGWADIKFIYPESVWVELQKRQNNN